MPEPTLSPRRVYLTGTFDVANYGDLLFPLVAQRRLAPAGIEVIAVSPTATRPPYGDAVCPVAVAAMTAADAPPVDGILVGGGHILIAQPAAGLATYEAAGVTDHAYPSLWVGAALAATVRDVPLLYNAPGAPFPYPTWRRDDLIRPALAAADYLSVRDAATRGLFHAPELEIEIVPDTVLDLDRLWPRDLVLRDHAALLQRKGLALGTPCLAVHVRGRALRDPDGVAQALSGLAVRHGLTPLLLAIGPELGDLDAIRALTGRMTVPHAVLDDPGTLREVAGAIAGSALYLGGSMHGFVTAAVYQVPGVLLAIPSYGKYRGLVGHLERHDDLARDWPEAIARADALLATGIRPIIPSTVRAALDRHWARIIEALDRPEAGRARRQGFLRSYMRYGVRRFGAEWLVGSQLSGGMRPPLAAAAE